MTMLTVSMTILNGITFEFFFHSEREKKAIEGYCDPLNYIFYVMEPVTLAKASSKPRSIFFKIIGCLLASI